MTHDRPVHESDDPLAALPPSPHCRSFHVGHQVHWIQAKLSLDNEPELLFLSGFEVHASGMFAVTTWEGRRVRLFNHDPRRVRGLLDDVWQFLREEPLELVDPCLLRFPSPTNAHPCVSAVSPDRATACNQTTVQDLVDDVVAGVEVDEDGLGSIRDPERRDLGQE